MNSHDRLKAKGIVPTTDCEKAYRLGQDDAKVYARHLLDRLDRLERALTEIALQAQRVIR